MISQQTRTGKGRMDQLRLAIYSREDERITWVSTCFDAKGIFQAYDRRTGQFVDLGYSQVADRFDAKFHRFAGQASRRLHLRRTGFAALPG